MSRARCHFALCLQVLKDIVNRAELLQGARVCFMPGWDCHGLPIELKALEALGGPVRARRRDRAASAR